MTDAQVTKQLNAKVTHIVWDGQTIATFICAHLALSQCGVSSRCCSLLCCARIADGDESLLERIDGLKGGSRPRVVSQEWLQVTGRQMDKALEAVYPIERDRDSDMHEQHEQPSSPAAVADAGGADGVDETADADEPHARAASEHNNSQQQADMADANADMAQQRLADGGADNATIEAAEEQQQQQEQQDAATEAEAEPLKPGWSRKKKSDWAENDPTTPSIAQFEKETAADETKRAADGVSAEIDDVDMAAADDESQWVDEDKEEADRERKKGQLSSKDTQRNHRLQRHCTYSLLACVATLASHRSALSSVLSLFS